MFKKFIKNNLTGILGTVIFHLVLLIGFMIIQIKQIKVENVDVIMMDFSDIEPPELEKDPETKKEELKKLLKEINNVKRRNVAVNESEDFKKQISTEEYLKQLKDELDFQDREEGWRDKMEKKYQVRSEEKGGEKMSNPDVKPDETNITYVLKNRFARYIHNPVYKCMGSAIVVLDISVDVKGDVVNASVDSKASNTNDPCFHEQAIDAAKKWRFNADYAASVRQKGTMTFKFVAQ